MRVDWQTVNHHFFTRAFLLFLIVGTINTFLCSFLATVIEQLFGNPNLANNIGYI